MVVSSNSSNRPDPLSSRAVEAAFASFDDELKLDLRERAKAERLHREVTEHLKSDGVAAGTFLQGSLARKTMLKPLRDIDKVVTLGSSHVRLLGASDGPLSAATLVERSLRTKYSNITTHRSRHAVQVDFGSASFSFDIVPAFEVEDDSDDIWIMDLEKSSWKRSNSRELIRVVSARNQLCSGMFVHQVRMVKSWARQNLGEGLPGLHTEAIAFLAVLEKMGHAEAVARIFNFGVDVLGRTGYLDPTGRERLSDKLTEFERQAAYRAFADAAAKANHALSLDAAGREDEALAVWHDIFGEYFVAGKPKGFQYLKNLGLGAGAGTGILTSETQTTPTRPWAP